jgi:DASS family divalent anion:Na+ symporter
MSPLFGSDPVPATPSNTARGGIVLPIINSVAVALGSEPEHSAKRVGHYLMMNVYMVTKTTSYMFLRRWPAIFWRSR